MPHSGRRNPSRFLLDPAYWRGRLADMESVSRGLLIFPRPDLCSPLVDVVEWSLRAHDGTRLWGIKAQSNFHPEPQGIWIRQFGSTDAPAACLDAIYEGCVDFALQIPAGRRLEDRVLDALRVWRAAQETCDLEPARIHFTPAPASDEPDEFLIASRLLQSGICSLP